MANAVATLTVKNSWVDRVYNVTGTLAISASPAVYVTGGITMNLNQADVKASRTPESVEVFGTSGYAYRYVKGTDNSNGKLLILQQDGTTGPLNEIGASAIPAGVSGDTIRVNAFWRGMF